MSRTYNSKQRGVRRLKNKLYEFNLRLSFNELLHAKKKDKTKNRILRKKLKEQAKKEVDFNI